ncbi:putative clathrin coat assembly protein AP50 [Neospora caninum Liverpool]|uniref:Clathrin coat assembly protein AP50, putative n=1 Tax=Neospora caninum (strain Liverpool) TaxID=572307 RepID=F0VHY3_NEOCL|nr:putative clathrin coat assembly protein AP50 [Neospora caninum Liverpool]CBZ53344.1 putative clathrin coat assembly protein AP50 [Neospora caninum Liverpool]CEL67329.1 TPA: clathrin coat assembly protein AP50, putative [Neospora caninum Liverpool]|eukprot:XP_003883376.1 putative clathrin coat assembly protein AP50 [Neospora caninum Liverpool]
MISAIYIFTLKGELLLQRAYASPVPPPHHLRAFSRTVLAGRAFSELAPVVCVGHHASSRGASPCAVSSFSCFVPPFVNNTTPNVFVSASPASDASAPLQSTGVVPTAAIVRGRRERRWGTGGSDDDGIVYVAALRQNANVACVLEVLRRLAALVQAFYVASVNSASTGPILPASYQQNPDLPAFSPAYGAEPGPLEGGLWGAGEDPAGHGASPADAGAVGFRDSLFSKKAGSSFMGAVRRGLSSAMGSASLYVDASFVRKHYVLLYEILDEAIDGGFPQLLDLATLRKFTTFGNGPGFHWPPDHDGFAGLVSASLRRGDGGAGTGLARAFSRGGQRDGAGDIAASKRITSQVTGACSWRSPGIRYKRNEVFIDVIECVNVLLSQNGVVLRSDVNGEVVVNCQLTGMPECKFGLNDRLPLDIQGDTLVGGAGPRQKAGEKKDEARAGAWTSSGAPGVTLDDCRFHQCVRLSKFDLERTISFIPPDGTFRLMTYRISEGVSLPFKIFPLLQERSDTRMECVILLKALFDRNISASNVEVIIPCPPNLCDLQLLHVGIGKAAVDNAQQAVVWKIKKLVLFK